MYQVEIDGVWITIPREIARAALLGEYVTNPDGPTHAQTFVDDDMRAIEFDGVVGLIGESIAIRYVALA